MATIQITKMGKIEKAEVKFPFFSHYVLGENQYLFAAWDLDKTIWIHWIAYKTSLTLNANFNLEAFHMAYEVLNNYSPINERKFFDTYRMVMNKMPFDRSKEVNPQLASTPSFFRNNEINNQTTHY
jgi:hypothetical protein